MTHYRQRIEDLGIIQEKLDRLQEQFSHLFYQVQSKHQVDEFFERYLNTKNLHELFYQLKSLKETLEEVEMISEGYED